MAQMWINGALADAASGATYEVKNPATGAVVDKAPKAGKEDAIKAMAQHANINTMTAKPSAKNFSDTLVIFMVPGRS